MRITVAYGANTWPFTVDDGTVVGDIRDEFGAACQIPDDAVASIRGEDVDSDHRLHEGDTITFQKRTGTKG